jgi:MFS family permease
MLRCATGSRSAAAVREGERNTHDTNMPAWPVPRMSRFARVRSRTDNLFYGWYVVSAAAGLQALQAMLLMQGYGAYVAVFSEEFGWSKASLSGAAALQRVESGLLGPPQGWMITRFGARRVMYAGNLILGVGFMLFSQINSMTTFYLCFLMMAVGASLSGFMSIMTTIVQWFERRRATAMAYTQVGMSIGGMLVPVVAWSLVHLRLARDGVRLGRDHHRAGHPADLS